MKAEIILCSRLELSPLKASDADEMHRVLNDQELYRYTGGQPPSPTALKQRYERLESQLSPDGHEAWLNWVVRLRKTGVAVGTVQAGVSDQAATLAWVIGLGWQGQGLASEAALELVSWLVTKGVRRFTANIHPQNIASQIVARRVGLIATDEVVDGEVVWRMIIAGSDEKVLPRRLR